MNSPLIWSLSLSLGVSSQTLQETFVNNCNALTAFSISRLFQYIFGLKVSRRTFYLTLITNIIPRRADKVRGLYLVVNTTITLYKKLLIF